MFLLVGYSWFGRWDWDLFPTYSPLFPGAVEWLWGKEFSRVCNGGSTAIFCSLFLATDGIGTIPSTLSATFAGSCRGVYIHQSGSFSVDASYLCWFFWMGIHCFVDGIGTSSFPLLSFPASGEGNFLEFAKGELSQVVVFSFSLFSATDRIGTKPPTFSAPFSGSCPVVYFHQRGYVVVDASFFHDCSFGWVFVVVLAKFGLPSAPFRPFPGAAEWYISVNGGLF